MRTQMHQQWQQTWIAASLVLIMALAAPAIWAKDADVKLPDAALEVIETTYPGCTIREVEVEDERNIRIFEVTISLKNRIIELEVTGDGNIVETEEKVAQDAIPAALKTEIAKLTAKGNQVMAMEKHEILSVRSLGAFRWLAKPVVFYDIKIRDENGKRRSVQFEQVETRFVLKDQVADDDDDDDDDD